MQRSDEQLNAPLTIHYYAHPDAEVGAGQSSSFELYEDDGITQNYRKCNAIADIERRARPCLEPESVGPMTRVARELAALLAFILDALVMRGLVFTPRVGAVVAVQ